MKPEILFQILYRPIYVPVRIGADSEPSPAIFDISDHSLVLGFSTALSMTMICGEGVDYVEFFAKDIFPQLRDAQIDFGYNFGQDDAVIYTAGQLDELLEQGANDRILDVPEKVEFVKNKFSESLIKAFEAIAPHDDVLAIAYEKELGLVLCVSQKELQAHFGLLAHLHEAILQLTDQEIVTILPYRELDDLGVSFAQNATWIGAKPVIKEKKPPILR